MNKKKLLAAVIIFLIALIFFNKDSSNDWWKVSRALFKPITEKLTSKYGLIYCGGGGKMSEDYTYISLDFQIFKSIKIDEAREIIINSAEEYIKAINSSAKLKSFMPNAEFKLSYLQLTFYIRGSDNRDIYDPFISCMSLKEGIVNFKTTDPEKKYGYKSWVRAPYEEVKDQSEGLQR